MSGRARRAGRRTPLESLALRAGIIPTFVDTTGRERTTSNDTRVALLAAMGVDAGTAASARHALEQMDEEDRSRLVEPVVVARSRPPSLVLKGLPVGARVEWSVEARDEKGVATIREGSSRVPKSGRLGAAYPALRGHGYRDVRVQLSHGGTNRTAAQRLVLTPWRCPSPATVLGPSRAWGVTANLYSVRGVEDWGIGDLGDLRSLVTLAAKRDADFVGVNPLHALRERGGSVSPYSPTSRVYRESLYLRMEDIPEIREAPDVAAMAAAPELRDRLARLRASERIEYDAIRALQRPILRALHRAFVERHEHRATARGHAYASYVAAEGAALDHFATFMALDEHFSVTWRRWPVAFRDPSSAAVLGFRNEHAEDVSFFRWCQFEIDRQLNDAQETARGAGMRLGLYQDLAVGASADGSDAWAYQSLFAKGVSIGAPPDPFARQGQNWALPPLDPRAMRRDGHKLWTRVLRAALAHSGAVRIDHVMGLFRLFWVPDGKRGDAGAYVRYPADELLGILALESTRAGAIVVGENLGTVPPEVPRAMKVRRMLSSKVLYFERTTAGAFRAASRYPAAALVTANTHDLPTIEAWWRGLDIELRARHGLIGEAAARRARAERERERGALVRRLVGEGILPRGTRVVEAPELRDALHRFLFLTPSALVGIALDDLAGELDPVNLPGVTQAVYPSWVRRMRASLETGLPDPAATADA